MFYLLLLCCIHDFNISDKIQGVSSIAFRLCGCGAENTKRDNRCSSGAKTPVQNQTGPTSDQWPVVRCPCDSWDHGAPVVTQWHRLQSHNSDELNINKQIVRLLLLGWRWHRLSCGICSEATRKMSWGTELWVSGIKFGEWVRGIFARTLLGWVQRKCEIIISASLNRDTGSILLTTKLDVTNISNIPEILRNPRISQFTLSQKCHIDHCGQRFMAWNMIENSVLKVVLDNLIYFFPRQKTPEESIYQSEMRFETVRLELQLLWVWVWSWPSAV